MTIEKNANINPFVKSFIILILYHIRINNQP